MWSRHWRAAGLLSDRNLAPFANFVLTSQLCKEMYLTHSGNMEKASQMGPCLFGLYPNGLFMLCFVVRKRSLLPKVPIFETKKMALQVANGRWWLSFQQQRGSITQTTTRCENIISSFTLVSAKIWKKLNLSSIIMLYYTYVSRLFKPGLQFLQALCPPFLGLFLSSMRKALKYFQYV